RNPLDCDAVAEGDPDFYWKADAPNEYVASALLERLPSIARRLRLTGVLHARIEQSLPADRWFVLSSPIRERKVRRAQVFLNVTRLPPRMEYFATQYRDIVGRCAVVEGLFVPAPEWWTGDIRGDMTEVQSLAVWSEPRETAPPAIPQPQGPPFCEP